MLAPDTCTAHSHVFVHMAPVLPTLTVYVHMTPVLPKVTVYVYLAPVLSKVTVYLHLYCPQSLHTFTCTAHSHWLRTHVLPTVTVY